MKFTLNEMNGLLNGKCLPSDLLVGETLAEYLVRQFCNLNEQLAESHRALAALAAENAGLIEQAEEVYAAGYNHGHLNTVDGIAYADCVKDDFYGLAVELMCEAETPDTDAFLAEVRAQGVEMMAAEADQLMDEFGDDSYKVMVTADLQLFANAFAAQLRKGVQP